MINYYCEEEDILSSDDWSELPQDLLGLITDKLISSLSLPEYIRFGSVCMEWRSFSIRCYPHIKLPSNLPVLLLPNSSPPPPPLSFSCSSSTTEDEEDDSGEDVGVDENEDGGEDVGVDENEDGGEEEEQEDNTGEDVGDEEDEEYDSSSEDEYEEFRRNYASYFNPKHIWAGQDAKQRYKSTRSFYSLSEKRVHHDFPLPIPYYKNIRGSSHGWLVTVEECYRDDNGQPCYPVRLLNPFRTADNNNNNNEIQLPPLIHGNPGNIEEGEIPFHSYYLVKVHLSENPSSLSDLTKLVVLAVYGQYNLGFCRPGHKSWTTLDVYKPVFDIIWCTGQFFAVLQSGYVFSFVLDEADNPIVKLKQAPPKEENFKLLPKGSPKPNQRYLVESDGYLLQVRRDVITTFFPDPSNSGVSYVTIRFKVFRLEMVYESSGQWVRQWVEMKTLGDRMLFLGTSGSISLPVFPGCKPNSIYFTDELNDGFRPLVGPHDIGVFNLEDGTIEPHYKPESTGIMPPPIWIQPML